jgi:hypothetical protein
MGFPCQAARYYLFGLTLINIRLQSVANKMQKMSNVNKGNYLDIYGEILLWGHLLFYPYKINPALFFQIYPDKVMIKLCVPRPLMERQFNN